MDYAPGFPLRATGPMFKGTKAEARAKTDEKKQQRRDYEDKNKTKVRKDDDWTCRFPRCACVKKRTHPDVAHDEHKAMGGDPLMQRSGVHNLICLCPARHKESRLSLHAGTIRMEYLQSIGTRGAVRWWVDATAIDTPIAKRQRGDERWVVVGTEELTTDKPRRWVPFTKDQAALLERIAELSA
jgi:hypothetical protein